MRTLRSPLRKQLESAVPSARRASESASRAALDGLGVFTDRRPEHLDADQVALRDGLRAKWSLLGRDRGRLAAECAYKQWHSLLFARFLAENNFLLHPEYQTPVTIADCEELAAELGEPDAWSVAARFASEILPGVFRLDDPCVRLRLAPEGRHALGQILNGLPAGVFLAKDALRWMCQSWQKDKKDEINASERKISGADLGPVTQLSTENYMVRFLLENSLGAWWAARHPDSPLVKGFEYLRFDDGKPAAGSFDGWPDRAAEVTVMDPCCGSGHFLVEAFSMLWQMRAEEDGLSPVEAQNAVLRDNLFGLEIDDRCVQIAMFAVALKAWRADGGWRQLPIPHIASSSILVKAPIEDWKALAGGDKRLENALVRLHALFRDADTLGSLLNPELAVYDGWHGLDAKSRLIRKAIGDAGPMATSDAAAAIFSASVEAAKVAGVLLGRRYHLVVTNPPFLARGKQGSQLREYLDQHFAEGRQDLATAFLQRARSLCKTDGTVAIVMPHNWLVQPAYRQFRRLFLDTQSLALVALLGEEGFEAFGNRGPRVDLFVIHNSTANAGFSSAVIDVATPPSKHQVLIPEKIRGLQQMKPTRVLQADHAARAGERIVFGAPTASDTLGKFARSYQGLKTGDDARYKQSFWEMQTRSSQWKLAQGASIDQGSLGLHFAIAFGETGAEMARAQGMKAWGRLGLAVSRTRSLSVKNYVGCPFLSEIVAIVPSRPEFLPAIREFARSGELEESIRAIDQATILSNGTFQDIPFDRDYWGAVAAQQQSGASSGTIVSRDPTDWSFSGWPETSTAPLQVAIGRLINYRWPRQREGDKVDDFVDPGGIVCLSSIMGRRQRPIVCSSCWQQRTATRGHHRS